MSNRIVITLALLLMPLLWSCSSKKKIAKTPAPKKEVVQQAPKKDKNAMAAVCKCENFEELTIDEYAVEDKKKKKMEQEEYNNHVLNLFINNPTENWVIQRFLKDGVFSNQASEKVTLYKRSKELVDKRTHDKWEAEVKTQYPICHKIFTYIMTLGTFKK